MIRNFINLPDLHTLIAHEVTAAPLPADLKPPLDRLLRHVLPSLPVGHRDLPRAGDPAWAHRAARADQPLFRLDDRARRDARAAIRAVLLDVETLVEIAARAGHPHAAACARCLRGIDHWRNLPWIHEDSLIPGLDHWKDPLSGSLAERVDAALNAGEQENLPRFSARVLRHGGVEGRRATTLAEVRALGREARNCLARVESWSTRPLAGASEIWALRHGGQLVAVLSRKDDGTVDALNGPENDPVAPERFWPVLSWLAASGFPLGELEMPAEALVAHMRRPREDALAA